MMVYDGLWWFMALESPHTVEVLHWFTYVIVHSYVNFPEGKFKNDTSKPWIRIASGTLTVGQLEAMADVPWFNTIQL